MNFNILRVERDGVVKKNGVEIKPGQQVTGVKFMVSYGTGIVRGEVQFLNGPLPAGGRVDVWLKKGNDPAIENEIVYRGRAGHLHMRECRPEITTQR